MKLSTAMLIFGAMCLPGVASAETTTECGPLAHLTIPATDIGLPTRGAVVTGAQMVEPDAKGSRASGPYCLVSGSIAPFDPMASEIRFQVALPETWNQKVLMLGGGGFDGVIPDVVQSPNNLDPSTPSPLARGYAVFADDGGHKDPGAVDPNAVSMVGADTSGAFLMNDEAYRNWMGDALKKTHDAVVAIVRANYGRAPAKSYFVGGSSGGREGLLVAGRWPGDWNGVVSLYPARNSVLLTLGAMGVSRALALPGAWPNPAKRQVLFRAALAACDMLDGAADGVISDVKRCNAVFKPKTAMLDGKPIRCLGGADTGDTCLSDAQLAALDRMNAPVRFTYPLADGEQIFPGYNAYTSDSGLTGASPYRSILSMLSIGDAPPTHPINPGMFFAGIYADNFVRFGITRDPNFDPLTLDPEHPGKYAARIRELGEIETVGDLGRFQARGGKLFIMHGTGDLIVSPRMTEAYYTQLIHTMGAKRVASFLRFYEVPALAHGVSDVFNASWDYLTALENWAERGIDPAQNEITTDSIGVPGRTRPLCLYPAWPKYRGAGDVNNASSFTCAVK